MMMNSSVDACVIRFMQFDIGNVAFDKLESGVLQKGGRNGASMELDTGHGYGLARIQKMLTRDADIASNIQHVDPRFDIPRDLPRAPQTSLGMPIVISRV